MKFVVFNHFNNNTDRMYHFKTAAGNDAVSEMSTARISDTGVCFFTLRKRWDEDKKLEVLARLHEKLKTAFGAGLSGAILPDSDCVAQWRYAPFFDGVQKIDPVIKRIQMDGPLQNETHADVRIDDRDPDPKSVVMKAVGATEQDIEEATNGGWQALQQRLQSQYDGILKELGL